MNLKSISRVFGPSLLGIELEEYQSKGYPKNMEEKFSVYDRGDKHVTY